MTRRHAHVRALNEQSLLELALERSELAWLELMRRYRKLIYGCIHRTLSRYGVRPSEDSADDVFADVCLRLLTNDMRRLRAFNPDRGSKLSSWIGLVAINAAHDHLRARARVPAAICLDDGPECADSTPDPLVRVLQRERSLSLRRLVHHLPARDRAFLDLCLHRDLSPHEIARRLRISVKTVYSRRSRIERRLANLARTPPPPPPRA